MSEIRFQTILGEDRVIHIPPGLQVDPGRIEVVVSSAGIDQEDALTRGPQSPWPLVASLMQAAKECGATDLPPDLAENHDHYAHGAPKGIDQL